MSNPSDQAAAESAERSGDRFRPAPTRKLYVMDVYAYWAGERAIYRWVKPFPEVWFRGDHLPWCASCRSFVKFTAPPTHLPEGAGWCYPIECGCGADEVLSPFPLAVGGPVSWWRERGWKWSGWAESESSPDSEEEAAAATIGSEADEEQEETPHEARREERGGEGP